MPKTPKRPRDVNQWAKRMVILQLATPPPATLRRADVPLRFSSARN